MIPDAASKPSETRYRKSEMPGCNVWQSEGTRRARILCELKNTEVAPLVYVEGAPDPLQPAGAVRREIQLLGVAP